MVVSLGPGKFYGSSLPRPRYYTDIKFNTDRVDPPVPVMDPFLSWATEAHWSMGGLSFQRLRLQGRIEGNIEKLRKQREKVAKGKGEKEEKGGSGDGKLRVLSDWSDDESEKGVGSDESPPLPPVAEKRRKRFLVDSEEDEDEEESGGVKKRRLARKLNDEFDMVSGEGDGLSVLLGKKKRSKEGGFGGSENIGVHRIRIRKLVDEKGNLESSEGLKRPKKGKKSVSSVKGGSSVTAGARTSSRLLKKKSS